MPTTPCAADQAYAAIRGMLIRTELKPGQEVSQTELARHLGCSTVPIVEAMRRLESEGLQVKDGRKIARVRQLSRRDREGLYLVREGLEGVTAKLCAARITNAHIEELRELGRQYKEAVAGGDTPESDPTDTTRTSDPSPHPGLSPPTTSPSRPSDSW